MALDPVPCKTFVKDLRRLDPLLELEWDRVLELWCIYYNAPDGNRFKLIEVKNEDGSYRPLDERTINLIKMCDWSRRIGTPLEFVKKNLNAREEAKQKQKEKQLQELMYKTKHLMPKLEEAWANEEKGIFYDSQIHGKTYFFNEPGIVDLFGRKITLEKENKNVDIKPNTDSNYSEA
jgi:DNA-binding transcriptional MerR regulator